MNISFFYFTPDNCVCCEIALFRHNTIFSGYCPMSETNIQAWSRMKHFCKALHAICLRESWTCFLTLLFILNLGPSRFPLPLLTAFPVFSNLYALLAEKLFLSYPRVAGTYIGIKFLSRYYNSWVFLNLIFV